MMERRLRLAKDLLNPADSVLIVTIDENEYLRLGLLLEQVFPDARIQMVSSQINPAAVARAGEFGRSDEYIYFVKFGVAGPRRTQLSREWVSSKTILTDPAKKHSNACCHIAVIGCSPQSTAGPPKKRIEFYCYLLLIVSAVA